MKDAKSKAEALITETWRELQEARREAELTSFEVDNPPTRGSVSSGDLETILSRAERVLSLETSLTADSGWQEWQRLPPDAQEAESELRNAVAKRVERAANDDRAHGADDDLSVALARWTETVHRLSLGGSRPALVCRIAAEAQHLGITSKASL